MTKWRYKENTKIKECGITDFAKKEILINPTKGEVIETIIHERLHKEFPEFSEAQTVLFESYIIKHLNLHDQQRILKNFVKKLKK